MIFEDEDVDSVFDGRSFVCTVFKDIVFEDEDVNSVFDVHACVSSSRI
jgi:hypothetical protein